MKIDTALLANDLTDVPRVAKAAEALGFDGLWTAEAAHDPFVPAVLAAEHTTRIEIGTAIAVAFPRSPMVFAHIAWDLAALSRGRFSLGLGTQVKGHNERRYSVKWEAPGPKLREMVQALRAIWDCWQNGTPLGFRGQYYTFTLMTPFFAPPPLQHPNPKIPIFIAGVNPYMCRLAGELCDGFHVHPLHSIKHLREVVIPNVERGLAISGRARKDIELASTVFVITGRNRDEIEAAKAPVRQQIAFYASTRTYRGVLDVHGWGATCERLNERVAGGDWGGMADEITDEMLDVFTVIGTHEEIGAKLRAKYTGVLDRIAYYMPYRPGTDDAFYRQAMAALRG
jgi:probable F420-dependent oxidoreductase